MNSTRTFFTSLLRTASLQGERTRDAKQRATDLTKQHKLSKRRPRFQSRGRFFIANS